MDLLHEKVELVVRERLRSDAPVAWAMASDDWLEQQLRSFYSSELAFYEGLAALIDDLRLLGFPVEASKTGKLKSPLLLDLPAKHLIEMVVELVSQPVDESRPHRGSQKSSNQGEAFTSVTVYYATDREHLLDSEQKVYDFGPGRDDVGLLHYGACEVTVPASHRIGHLESPRWWRFEFRPDPEKHITLRNIAALDEALFFGSVCEKVTSSPGQDAFVFVHGFNVSFQDAAKRAAQMAFDLEFQGAPIIYSWPSKGETLDYVKDEASVIWTVPHLEYFLQSLAAQSGAARIHVIAHSMGNRAVCDALERLSRSTWRDRSEIHHLVLTAPDIDASTFKNLASSIRTTANSVTLYASRNDKAIRLSEKIHGYPRAGTPVVLAPGIETVDASTVETDFLGHSLFSTTRTVLSDIFWLLREDKPARHRFGLHATNLAGDTYYVIRK